ncbi:MAG: UDP-glucose/GDP-mannose dehydrogenase family protein [Brevinematales bacterium]|nr:UDP-glucose/GDP-mannose dehydrogenase family protein [Brevinematales bacterium]
MKICMVGTGYVGLVSGTCLAEIGNEVICIDNNQEKIDMLNSNIVPIYEPRLEELIESNRQAGRLTFSTDIKYGIEKSDLIFIAVGTPTSADGSADLKYVFSVAKDIGKYINGYKVIVNKSTVPVGTAEKVKNIILETIKERGSNFEFDVVSNPEFLKEGAAVEDFMRPDRVVIGADSEKAANIMMELYSPFVKNGHPVILVDTKSSEIIKYASNCMLALRISFMNEISKLCEVYGADILKVRQGLGTDKRIGMPFLYAGVGYGGSCFPKDVKAMIKMFQEIGEDSKLFEAIDEINDKQRERFVSKILNHFHNNLTGKKIAIWGLAFKPNTDDMREAPSVYIINRLLDEGVKIFAYDPKAVKEAKKIFGEDKRIVYVDNQYEAIQDANALVLITEWNCFKEPDFERIYSLLKEKVIFDGRNIYEPEKMRNYGFTYYSIGRP